MNLRMKKSFEAFGLRWSRTKERGATAVVIALCLTLLMAAAAMSFDTANLALERQRLQNITDAAAQAGASYLPDTALAKQAANEYFHRYDRTPADTSYNPTLNVYCMVESAGVSKQPAAGALIAAACDPNPGFPVNYANGVGGTICDEQLCAIPCTASNAKCNAIEVTASRYVPFYFAPAIGIKSPGETGDVTSVSCHNECGSGGKPNPMDVAIVADRTPSMIANDANVTVDGTPMTSFKAMQASIKKMLTIMTPEVQFVTLGTIHESGKDNSDPNCLTKLGPAAHDTNSTPTGGGGKWMPLPYFSNSYLNPSDPTGTRTLKMTPDKASLGYQVDCMDSNNTPPWGTHLAAPLKAAARMLLPKYGATITGGQALARNTLTNNAPVSQWIIFETDGVPEETMTASTSSATDLGNSLDPSTRNAITGKAKDDLQACENLKTVARNARAANINIMMIAFGTGTMATCGNSTSTMADYMAAAAGPPDLNTLSKAPVTVVPGHYVGTGWSKKWVPASSSLDCATANSDNDFFFCATTGDEMANVFTNAFGMTSSANTKFVKMPK